MSEWAALALDLITGANIEETVFAPVEIDEKELFQEELDKLERGGPLYSPGKEPGPIADHLAPKPESIPINGGHCTEHAYNPV